MLHGLAEHLVRTNPPIRGPKGAVEHHRLQRLAVDDGVHHFIQPALEVPIDTLVDALGLYHAPPPPPPKPPPLNPLDPKEE